MPRPEGERFTGPLREPRYRGAVGFTSSGGDYQVVDTWDFNTETTTVVVQEAYSNDPLAQPPKLY